MKKSSKILLSTALLATFAGGVVVPVVGTLTNPTSVYAVEGSATIPAKTTVTIHKLQADSYTDTVTKGNGIENKDGEVLDQDKLNELGTNVLPLSGVTFKWYKITDTKTKEELTAMTKEQLDATYKENGELTPTNDQGVTTHDFDSNATARYWVIESNAPKEVSSSIAVPFELTFPMSASNGSGYLSSVNIYPKNLTSKIPHPDKDVKTLGNNEASFNIGETATWYLKGTIPTNIDKYEAYEFSDKLDAALDYVGIGKVIVAGQELEKTTHYTVEESADNKTYKVALTKEGIAKVAELVPEANRAKVTEANLGTVTANTAETPFIQVELQTKINKDVTLGKDVLNDFVINYDNKPDGHVTPKPTEPSDKPKVYTGGKLFKKIDKDNATGAGLVGAEFELYKADAAVNWTAELIAANKADGDNAAKFTGTVAAGQPIKFKSGADGSFEIRGLSYDKAGTDYKLKETKAPEGFVIPADPFINFTVNATSYNKAETITAAATTNGDKADADKQNVENSKRPSIPNTGGIGSVIFVLAGLGAMVFAAFGLKKRNKG